MLDHAHGPLENIICRDAQAATCLSQGIPMITRIKNQLRQFGFLATLAALTLPAAQAQGPAIQFLTPVTSSMRADAFVLGPDDSLVWLVDGSLNIRSPQGTTRTIALPEAAANALRLENLSSSLVLRPDGRAFFAPPNISNHVPCPYLVIDTITGSLVSGAYEGVFRTFSKGEKETSCHRGIFTNPGAEQFSLATNRSLMQVLLIAYDGSQSTLTPSFSEEAYVTGRLVYLSGTQLLAQYSIISDFSRPVPVEKFVLFNLANSTQTLLSISQTDTFLELIKSIDARTVVFRRSNEMGGKLLPSMAFNLDTATFFSIYDINTAVYEGSLWEYRDRIYESSLGQPSSIQVKVAGSNDVCGTANGYSDVGASDICVSSGAEERGTPLRCFFPKQQLSGGATGGIGLTSTGQVVAVLEKQVSAITFPATGLDELPSYCAHLELSPESTCQKYLKPDTSFNNAYGQLFFTKARPTKKCTMTFQLLVGDTPVTAGSVVKYLSVNTHRRHELLAKGRTDANGKVSFKVRPAAFTARTRQKAGTSALFKYDGDQNLRAAEFTVGPNPR